MRPSKSMFNPVDSAPPTRWSKRLKVEAAQLGANGVILEDFNQTQSGSLGTALARTPIPPMAP